MTRRDLRPGTPARMSVNRRGPGTPVRLGGLATAVLVFGILTVAMVASLSALARAATHAGSPLPAPSHAPQASVQRHVEFLAADELEGRMTGTDGARKAADYIAEQLEAIGAQPLPGRDDYRLAFEFTAGVNDIGSRLQSRRQVGSQSTQVFWAGPHDVRGLSFSDSGEVTGGLVFAGYGLTIPEGQGYPYDSYATLDVADKIVLVLRYFPEDVSAEDRQILSRYSELRYKAMRARELGAKALLVVTGPRSPSAGELVAMSSDAAVAGSGIVAASMTGEVAERLFSWVGKALEETQAELDTGNPHITGFDFPDVELTLEVKVERERRTGHNVAGYLPPSDPTAPTPDKPFVVLGAHYDHLGHGTGGNSLARADEAGLIHNGADDNASGVAAVVEVGAQLAGASRDRGIVLAFWSGEELGLLGSGAFVESAPIPIEQIAAYLNFDMVGRSRDNVLTLQAVGSSDAWPRLIERTNVPVGFDIRTQDDPYLPTDSRDFNLAGVPTLSFFTGSHEDYHRPSDDADLLNYDDLARVVRFGALLARRVANLGEPPQFVRVELSSEQVGSRDSVRAFTGTIPDYTTEVEGLLLGGVIEGGPAAEAGLREGDVIVEFAGQTITNIYDYTYALEAVKLDEPIEVVYLRDGERHETTLTPRARR